MRNYVVSGRVDFERLAEALRAPFLLSLNDHPGVREAFAGFSIEAMETIYTVSGEAQRAGEVLISPAAG